MRTLITSFLLLTALVSPQVNAQGSADEIAKLKQQNELLQAKLEAANLKIEKLEQQLAGLADTKKTSLKTDRDLFATGTIWSGERHFVLPAGLKSQDIRLTITERDQTHFKGEITIFRLIEGKSHTDTYQVKGTATTKAVGSVDFTTEKKGFFQNRFQGKISNGELALDFGGSNFLEGSIVKGTAIMKPKN